MQPSMKTRARLRRRVDFLVELAKSNVLEFMSDFLSHCSQNRGLSLSLLLVA